MSSRRVCGLAGIQLSGKREAKQARPLSVKEIQDLHRAAASVTNRQAICCLWHTVGAGTATRWQWKMCCMITRKVPGMFNSGPSTTRVASRWETRKLVQLPVEGKTSGVQYWPTALPAARTPRPAHFQGPGVVPMTSRVNIEHQTLAKTQHQSRKKKAGRS